MFLRQLPRGVVYSHYRCTTVDAAWTGVDAAWTGIGAAQTGVDAA